MTINGNGRETKVALILLILLTSFGIWDCLAISCYVGSSLQLIAEGEGYDKVYLWFNPPRNSTLLIAYDIFVEPKLLAMQKYAVLKIVLRDSTGNVLWAKKVHKGVKRAVREASDGVSIDLEKVKGIQPYLIYVAVEKVGWGTLKKLRVEVKHNPHVKPTVYTPLLPLVEVFFSLLPSLFNRCISPENSD